MKKISLMVAGVILSTVLALAESPEDICKSYFEMLQNQEWDEISALYDKTTLHDFREMMSFMAELPDAVSGPLLTQFFGEGTTSGGIKEMSDEKFFSGFLKGVMAQAGSVNFEQVEVLGSVSEGDDVQHVVTRTAVAMGELSMDSMEVISFKRNDNGWKILLQGKIKGLAQQIKAALGKLGE